MPTGSSSLHRGARRRVTTQSMHDAACRRPRTFMVRGVPVPVARIAGAFSERRLCRPARRAAGAHTTVGDTQRYSICQKVNSKSICRHCRTACHSQVLGLVQFRRRSGARAPRLQNATQVLRQIVKRDCWPRLGRRIRRGVHGGGALPTAAAPARPHSQAPTKEARRCRRCASDQRKQRHAPPGGARRSFANGK